MKYLVVSDIHSNLEAMQAVLKYAKKIGYDQILCAGDVVGYNANPNEVIDILRNEDTICIRGNHDREVVGGAWPEDFGGPAAEAVVWTQANIGPDHLAWLAALPVGPLDLDGFRLVHGSHRDEDEYLFGAEDLEGPELENAPRMTFFGHTHHPIAFSGSTHTQTTGTVELRKKSWMINPGSVGQPRDGDSRTSFVIWDASKGTARFYRIPYDFKLTQKKILEAGLPAVLAIRLG